MAFENISTDDFFPLFKQTLADSFKVDSFFMHAPYHDFEKMDMGIRRMVWGEYSTNSPIFSIAEDSPYRIVVLESTPSIPAKNAFISFLLIILRKCTSVSRHAARL